MQISGALLKPAVYITHNANAHQWRQSSGYMQLPLQTNQTVERLEIRHEFESFCQKNHWTTS